MYVIGVRSRISDKKLFIGRNLEEEIMKKKPMNKADKVKKNMMKNAE